MRPSWIALGWTVLVLLLPALPQEPVFKAGANLVEVDVVVRDKKGPVLGLTKDDFTLLDNGKAQKISVFSVRSSSKSTQTARRAAVPLAPGTVSNRASGDEGAGTETVLLIDQKNTLQTDQAYAIQRIAKFVEQRRANDRIGIYVFGRDGILRAVQELTRDGEALTRAAKSLTAQDPSYRTSDVTGMAAKAVSDYICGLLRDRETDTKHVLDAIARHVAQVPGRKGLIWLSASFPIRWPPMYGDCVDFTPDMERLARTLNDANVALYAVDARGLMGALSGGTSISNAEAGGGRSQGVFQTRALPQLDGVATMNLLAGRTGGDVYLNDNGLEDSMRAAVEDADLTYVLGFYPAQDLHDHDVHSHSLKVKVSRSGVTVRSRENYSAMNAAVAVERPTPEQLLRDSLDATQVGLSASVTPDREKAGSYQVHLSVDLRDVKLERQADSWVGEIGISLYVEGGKEARTFTHKIAIPDKQLAASLERGELVEGPIAVDAPAGVLHIVVQDQATGAAGSVKVPLR